MEPTKITTDVPNESSSNGNNMQWVTQLKINDNKTATGYIYINN